MAKGPIKLAVLVSGGGTTLQNLIDQIAGGKLDARISVVVASRPGIGGIDRAARAKLMNFVVERASFATAEAFSQQVFK